MGYKKQVKRSRFERGMTLLEMLITLAISAILLTVVAPSVQQIVASNKTVSEINELSSVLRFARFTAIEQSSNVVVCPTSDFAECSTNWNQAKIAFIDDNGNGDRDTNEDILSSATAIQSANSMTGPSASIVFFENGGANASVSVQVCPSDDDTKQAKALNITLQGRVRVSVDDDNDGIVEDVNGDNVSCS